MNDKKLYEFDVIDKKNLEIEVKNGLVLGVFNNSVYEPVKIYELILAPKKPEIHEVVIECEDKCSQ